MGYTAPTTRASGYLVTAANWNTDLVDNITFLANPPACRVRHSANLSITDSTLTELGVTAGTTACFDTERYDTASLHDTVTNPGRITIPVAGIYLVSFNGHFVSRNDYFQIYADLRLNGTTTIATANIGSFNGVTLSPDIEAHTQYKFAVNDYVTVRVYQDNNANAAANLETQGNFSPEFSATWIGLG